MTDERIIQMIDDYLAEPSNINTEWVIALLFCKQAIKERKTLKIEAINEFVKRFKKDCCWVIDDGYVEEAVIEYIDNIAEEMCEEERL